MKEHLWELSSRNKHFHDRNSKTEKALDSLEAKIEAVEEKRRRADQIVTRQRQSTVRYQHEHTLATDESESQLQQNELLKQEIANRKNLNASLGEEHSDKQLDRVKRA
jgi:tRNA U34 5-carboxymethylaminomethyl modifying GTPase MnmE/TrmE